MSNEEKKLDLMIDPQGLAEVITEALSTVISDREQGVFAVLGVVDGVQLVLAASDVDEYVVHDEELEIVLDDPVIFEQLKLTFH
jgi:hypothetical protein